MTMTQWQERSRPLRLEKRYEFDDYDSLRAFLDQAADLSEERGLYPNIGFSRTHASFTIPAEDGVDRLSDEQREFARLLDSLEPTSRA